MTKPKIQFSEKPFLSNYNCDLPIYLTNCVVTMAKEKSYKMFVSITSKRIEVESPDCSAFEANSINFET